MLSEKIKTELNSLEDSEKALAIEFLLETLNNNENKSILNKWIKESEERLDAVHEGKLELIDYKSIKKEIL